MNNNKKLIVAAIAGIALCCTTFAGPGPRGGRPGGHGGRGGAPVHHTYNRAPQHAHHAHRPPPPPPPANHRGSHHHHNDGLGLAAGIVNLVHDIIAPVATAVVPQPVIQTTPVVYPTTTTVYQGW